MSTIKCSSGMLDPTPSDPRNVEVEVDAGGKFLIDGQTIAEISVDVLLAFLATLPQDATLDDLRKEIALKRAQKLLTEQL